MPVSSFRCYLLIWIYSTAVYLISYEYFKVKRNLIAKKSVLSFWCIRLRFTNRFLKENKFYHFLHLPTGLYSQGSCLEYNVLRSFLLNSYFSNDSFLQPFQQELLFTMTLFKDFKNEEFEFAIDEVFMVKIWHFFSITYRFS